VIIENAAVAVDRTAELSTALTKKQPQLPAFSYGLERLFRDGAAK
jgi:hypothetical protein